MRFNDEFPQKGKVLFSAKGKKFEVAHIGHGNVMNQILDYVHGYLFSANALLDQLEESKEYSTKENIQHHLDLYAMPIIFMYRQYFELSLKQIYLEYSDTSFAEQEEMIKNTQHNLIKAFEYTKPIIASVLENSEKQYLDAFENYIKQFHSYDEKSFNFRYPYDKKLNLIFNNKKINLYNLKERMNEIEEFLCHIMPLLDIKRSNNSMNKSRDNAIKLWKENKLQEAVNEYLEALNKKQFVVGEKHIDVLIGNAEIGIIYLEKKQLKEAFEHLKKAENIYKDIKSFIPAINFNISRVFNYIGLIFEIERKYENAIEYYTKSFNAPCVDIMQTLIAYRGIADVYEYQGNKEKVIEYLNKVIVICEENYGIEHEETIQAKKKLEIFINTDN